ncbi:MAG: DUF1345 domain-containing protein [Bifidobacteriaceae bacterium]|nr:DUF1345 domain-containing protein [Bifidobacteriaceae bacterium]
MRPAHTSTRRSEWSGLILGSISVLIALGLGLAGAWSYALVGAWAGVSVTYLVRVWHGIGRLSGQQTADHATADDPGHRAMDAMLVAAAVASLANVVYVLVVSRDLTGSAAIWHAVGALVSVALSWAVIHTLFTLRYARLYHAGGRGIDFNADVLPDYLDFAYVAFSVGMTYQVSDTAISVAAIRRQVLGHALLSYLFGTVVLAAAVNLVAGLVP